VSVGTGVVGDGVGLVFWPVPGGDDGVLLVVVTVFVDVPAAGVAVGDACTDGPSELTGVAVGETADVDVGVLVSVGLGVGVGVAKMLDTNGTLTLGNGHEPQSWEHV
jgi:hypothetical protein